MPSIPTRIPDSHTAQDLSSSSRSIPRQMWLAAAILGVVLAVLTLLRHQRYLSQAFDLGFYVQDVWAIGHGFWRNTVGGFHVFADHFSPVLILLSPAAYLPTAEALLILQAAAVSLGLIPAYRIGARHGGDRLGRLTAAWYGLSAAVWHAVMFDFHPVTLGVPLLMWMIDEVDRGAGVRRLLVVALVLALVREDLAVLAAIIMLQGALLRRDARLARWSLVPGAIGIGYMAWVSTWSGGMGGYHLWTRFAGDSPGSVLDLLGVALGNLAQPDSVVASALLLPMLVLPALAGWRRSWPGLGLLVFNSMVSYEAQGSLYYQYFAPAVPFIIWGAAEAWTRRPSSSAGPAFVATVGVLLALGPIVYLGYGLPDRFASEILASGDRASFENVITDISPRVAVSATDHVLPHLANREQVFPFPGPMVCSNSLIFYLAQTSFPPVVAIEWDDAVPGADWEAVLESWGYEKTSSNQAVAIWILEGEPPASVACPSVHELRRSIGARYYGVQVT